MKKTLTICISAMLCIIALAACGTKDKGDGISGTGQMINESETSDGSFILLDGQIDTEETYTEQSSEELSDNTEPDDEDLKAEWSDEYSSDDDGSYAKVVYSDNSEVEFNSAWKYAENAVITTGNAMYYRSSQEHNGIVVAVNAGHGTAGGTTVKTLCHPDGSPKTTGGTTASGSTMAVAVSSGMTFNDGVAESRVTLRMAEILRDGLLENGYDVLMLRDSDDVQLDNVARTVMANNIADCHIALHWDGDGLSYDKGCFYIAVPDAIKDMEPVASHWQDHNALGEALISGLNNNGAKINGRGSMQIDLTQTSYSTIPSVDIELGNACSSHSDSELETLKDGLVEGVNTYFNR